MPYTNLNYQLTNCEKLQSRERMLEVAFDFHTMCTESKRSHLYCVHSVISGLALEIILKSFNSKISDSEETVYLPTFEYIQNKQRWKNHNLMALLDNVPPAVRGYLFQREDIEIIEKFQNVFTAERYRYESSSRRTFDNQFIKLVGRTIFKMIALYKWQGSEDAFITLIDDIEFERLRCCLYRR